MIVGAAKRIGLDLRWPGRGGALAVFGTYRDEAWHTGKGRDSLWAARASRSTATWRGRPGGRRLGLRVLSRTRSLRVTLTYPPLVLSAVGGALALAAAPLYNFWHSRTAGDAVLWSPPHILVVFAGAAARPPHRRRSTTPRCG